jgi:hypothetical protein
VTHFVSASCEGNLCSVCKAPATHKLGEEILSDDPSNACPTCTGTWRHDGGLLTTWMRPCVHCGTPHFYNDNDDDSDTCKRCKSELHPISKKVCADFFHHTTGPMRHNLTAYVCCAHFTMIVGTASGCPAADVMHAGIARGAAVIERENRELRAALVEVCDQVASVRMAMVLVRASRAAANRTGQPFVLAEIEAAERRRLATEVAAERGEVVAQITEWIRRTTEPNDPCDGHWLADKIDAGDWKAE